MVYHRSLVPLVLFIAWAGGCQITVFAQEAGAPGVVIELPGETPPVPAPPYPGAAAPQDEAEAESKWQRLSRQTLGGGIFWGDELFFHDWRIQRNSLTGQYRLIDGHYTRHASGSFEHCRAELEAIRSNLQLPPMQGKAVVLLHGLGSVPATMSLVAETLRHAGGYTIVNMSYPSTRGNLEQHARSLARVIENLEGVSEINLVGHSMGNIVIRYYLGLANDPGSGVRLEPRLGRIVMIAPPNHGAELAESVTGNGFVRAVIGEAALELGPNWNQVANKLATPHVEFGIISGGRGDGTGFNPTLAGDDDGLVTLASTRLVGASDWAVFPCRHSLLLLNPVVAACTLSFVENGYFYSAEYRRPIVPEVPVLTE